MTNPAGINDLNRTAATGYGDVKRETQLTKEAPISGAPRAAQALNTPVRSQRQTQRRRPATASQAGVPPEQQPGTEPPRPTYEAQLGQLWNQLAQVPGASPLVAEYAQDAQP